MAIGATSKIQDTTLEPGANIGGEASFPGRSPVQAPADQYVGAGGPSLDITPRAQVPGATPKMPARIVASTNEIPAPDSRERRDVPGRPLEHHSFFGKLWASIRDFFGMLTGYLELLGIRFPVKHYQADVYAFDASGKARTGSDGEPVRTGITRGSRVSDQELRELAKAYRGILNLCREDGDSQDKLATSLGMHAAHLKILDNGHPTMEQIKAGLDFLTNPENQPVYVHCEAGVGRTGTMIGAYRIAVEGWTAQQAFDEAARYGSGLLQNQKNFLIAFEREVRAGHIAGYPRNASLRSS